MRLGVSRDPNGLYGNVTQEAFGCGGFPPKPSQNCFLPTFPYLGEIGEGPPGTLYHPVSPIGPWWQVGGPSAPWSMFRHILQRETQRVQNKARKHVEGCKGDVIVALLWRRILVNTTGLRILLMESIKVHPGPPRVTPGRYPGFPPGSFLGPGPKTDFFFWPRPKIGNLFWAQAQN